MMDATQYRSYVSDVIGNVTSVPEYLDDFTPDRQQYATYHNNTNWKDYVYREAFTQNYGVNVQGGDDVASYNLSIGYANAQSTLKDNDFSRLNMRFNTDVNVVKDLTCRLDVAYSNTTRDLRDDGFGGTGCAGIGESPHPESIYGGHQREHHGDDGRCRQLRAVQPDFHLGERRGEQQKPLGV